MLENTPTTTWMQRSMEITNNDQFSTFLIKNSEKVDMKWTSLVTGRNYLHIAAKLELVQTVKNLLKISRNQEILDQVLYKRDNGNLLPIHYSSIRLSSLSLERFLEAGMRLERNCLSLVKITSYDKMDKTARKYEEFFKICSKYKALNSEVVNQTNQVTCDGITPLHQAVLLGSLSMIVELVKAGAIPEPDEKGQTPILLAIKNKNISAAEYLIEHFIQGKKSIDVNFKNHNGDTYLHEASKSCKNDLQTLSIVDLLISKKAHLGVRNNQGETPIDFIFKHIQNPVGYLKERVLDPLIKVQYKGEQMNHQGMRILFLYDLLNPGSGGRSGHTGSENRPFNSLCHNISQRQDRKMLIEHPVVESFINLKFRKVKHIIYIQLVITLLYAIIFSVFSATKCSIYLDKEQKENTLIISPIILILYTEMLIFEIVLTISRGFRFNLSSAFGLIVFSFSLTNILYDDECKEYLSREISALSVLTAWIYSFSVLSLEPTLGKDTLIFYRIGRRLFILMLPYLLIITGFATAFSITLPGNAQFGHPISCINSVISMVLGELSYDSFPEVSFTNSSNPPSTYSKEFWANWKSNEYLAHFLYFLFLFICSIVVSNILVAFAVQDVESVMKNVHIDQLLAQAEYINRFEESKLLRWLDFSVPQHTIVVPGLEDNRKSMDNHILENAMKIYETQSQSTSTSLRDTNRVPTGWTKFKAVQSLDKKDIKRNILPV